MRDMSACDALRRPTPIRQDALVAAKDPEAPPTLYDWAGGREAFERLIDAFYDRVEGDDLLSPLFRGLPILWGVTLSHIVAVTIAYLLLTYLHVVLGEQAPKALALQHSEDVALLVTGPLLTFARAFRPFIRLIGNSSNSVVRLLRLPPHLGATTMEAE